MGAKVIHETRIIFPVGAGVSSTGRQAINDPNDVKAIQDSLNDIRPDDGGPDTPLSVTGRMDDATLRAINQFQLKQFGWHDNVIDPRAKTLRKLNEIRGTPLSPLDTALNPAPRLVPQNDEHHCWAAALESWLERTPLRDQLNQDQLIKEFRAVEDPETDAMTDAGWGAVGVRFKMAGKLFSVKGKFLNPNEITGEFLADKLTSNGYIVVVYNLVPGGPSHVNVLYGVNEKGERSDQTFVKAMDPFTRGNGGLVERPLPFYTRRSGVAFLWAQETRTN
jgi:hypothetical protein